jgi:uncharacterized protein YbjT (DUF2867 family)
MLLLTSSNGNQARPLLPRLAKAGVKVRALRKTAGGEAELHKAGAAEVVIGDMADPAVIAKAMKGVSAVYHIGPSAHPLEREIGIGMVKAAQQVGVEHFIYSTVLHPIITTLLQHERKRDVEEKLVESDLNFTILQPADFMQTVQYRHAFETGVYRLIWGGEKRQSLVDLEDVAEAAAKIVVEGSRHHGATYELSSADCLSPADIGQTISVVMGRPVQVVVDSVDDFLRTWFGAAYSRDRMPSEYATFKAISDWYWAHDFMGNANVLTMLLGRPPTTFRQFMQREFDRRDQSQRFAGTGTVFVPLR